MRRIKIEPQLSVNVHDLDLGWITYPMEVRVVDATVPDGPLPRATRDMRVVLMRSTARSHHPGRIAPRIASISATQQQDVALAARAPKADLLRLFGGLRAAA